MKGVSSLLLVALVASVYGISLEKSEWEALEKLRQENAPRKEKILSLLRDIGKEQSTANEKYNGILSRSRNREVENEDENIEKWRPGIPPNILALIKKYKQNSLNGYDPCKANQTKSQKKDDPDDSKDSEDSNVDIDGENSDEIKKESPIKNRHRRSAPREDKSSRGEDDSNSRDDNSSDEELRRSRRGKGKSNEKNSDESNSDEKSDNSDSDEKDSRSSRKDKPKKRDSDESDSDNKSDDSDSNKSDSKGRDKNSSKEKNSDDDSNDSDDDRNDTTKRRANKSKEKDSDESNSDDKSDDSDEKNPRESRKEKPKKKNSDESDSDNKSDNSDSNKSKKYDDDDSENSSEEQKWQRTLTRGGHQANNKSTAPWDWQPYTIWKLKAKRAELKNRLIGIVQIQKVIKFLENRTDEFKKRGQWERTPGLIKAIAAHRKLLAENINAVSRICNITEVEPNKISELINKCSIHYSPRWRKSSHVVRPILESKEAILNNSIPSQEFLAARRDLNRTHITQILNGKGLAVKEGEQVNGTVSWKSQPDKSAPPSDNAKAIQEETSLNSTNSSDNKKNGPGSNVDESAVLDKDQASNPTNGREGNGSKNLNDRSGSGSQVQSNPESRNAESNGVNVDELAVLDKDQAPKTNSTNGKEGNGSKNLNEQSGSGSQVQSKPESSNARGNGVNVDELAVLDKDQAPKTNPTNGKEGNGSKNLNGQSGSGSQVQSKPESSNARGNGVNVDELAVLDKDQAPKTNPTNGKEGNGSKNLNDQSGSGSQVQNEPESNNAGGNGVNPFNNENEIPGSNDDQPANHANQPPQLVPKSDEPENLDLKAELSSSSDNTAKVVATAEKISSINRKKLADDINKLRVDQIVELANLTELLVDHAEGESSTNSNNQTTAENQTDTTLENNETSSDTSIQTSSTTSQTEQSSEISENTDTTETSSSSTLSTEGTTETTQNANTESESIFNTTAPKSTSLIDE